MRSTAASRFAHDFPWFHRWMGLAGNALFVVGSVFFVFDSLVMPGTWIFVGASCGMFVDSVGEKLLRQEDEHRRATGEATAGA
jgi:hypothetical protein